MLEFFLSLILVVNLTVIVIKLSYVYLVREKEISVSYKEFRKKIALVIFIPHLICSYSLLIRYGFTSTYFILLILLSIFFIISISDYYSYTIPNEASYGLIIPAILVSLFVFNKAPLDILLGAFIGVSVLLLLRYVFFKYRGVEAVGLGDIKLLISLGFLVGLSGLYIMFSVATFSALIYAVLVKKVIPFGPFLCLGTFVSILLAY